MINNRMLNEMIVDKMTKVCVCKSISQWSIKNEISSKNLKTVEEVFAALGAGSGSCHGRNCRPKIQKLLDEINSI